MRRGIATDAHRDCPGAASRGEAPATGPFLPSHDRAGPAAPGDTRPPSRAPPAPADGTLTEPVIDFADMRRRVGVGPTGDILEVIAGWPAAEQERARRVLAEIEREALERMRLMGGVVELCAELDRRGVPRALVTRNVKASVDHLHAHHFPLPPFAPAISRECGYAFKPSPEALLACAAEWGVDPAQVVMIGDSAKDDVASGRRAGAFTILLDSYGRYAGGAGGEELRDLAGTEAEPHHVAADMAEVRRILLEEFELPGGGEEPCRG